MQAVILAGGKGTRLGALAADRPKPMVNIAGKPILLHQLDVAKRYGCTRILMLLGHRGDYVREYFGDGTALGLNIRYVQEEVPLGTAGAIRAARAELDAEFFLFYGDIIFDVALDRVAAFHRAAGAIATLVVHPNDHPYDSDLVDLDANDRVRAVHRKDRPSGEVHRNIVNTGLYLMSRDIAEHIPDGLALDFGLDVFQRLIADGHHLGGYRTTEFIKDVGTPDRLARVEKDILSGKVARCNLEHPRPAVFLDRDGVLNAEAGEGVKANGIVLLDGVGEAVRAINRSGYLTIGVTNQPGLAKGFFTQAELEQTLAQVDTLLGEKRAYLDDMFVCPHHSEKGFAGEVVALKIDCDCRKPKPGLLLEAARRYNIDLARSFMIGDRSVDIAAGQAAGARTVLVKTGHGGRDNKVSVTPDLVCDDLTDAVRQILPAGENS